MVGPTVFGLANQMAYHGRSSVGYNRGTAPERFNEALQINMDSSNCVAWRRILLAPSGFDQSCALCYTQAASSGLSKVIQAMKRGILILIATPTFNEHRPDLGLI